MGRVFFDDICSEKTSRTIELRFLLYVKRLFG